MKKLFLFLGLSLIYAGISAQQQYKPCLDDGIVRWSFLDYHIVDAGWVSTELAAYGDTLINNYVYKKMYYLEEFNRFDVSEDNEKWKNHQPVLSNDWPMRTYIRESEDASKLYIYDAVREKEHLISDMDLQEGDTLVGYPFGHHGEVRDYVVVSVYIKNGLKHIRLISLTLLPVLYNSITFIESIGPDVWYLYPYMIWNNYEGFLNCFQNQSVFYKNEEVDKWGVVCPCGYMSLSYGIKDIVTSNLTIVTKDEQIKILFSEKESVRVSLYNLSGQLWYNRQLSTNECVIETVSFPKGMYLLKVFYIEKNKVSINKIII